MSTYEEVAADLEKLGETAFRIKAERDELLAAANQVLAYFDSGELCRSTKNDHQDDWAIRMIPVVGSLSRLREATRKAEGIDE